MAYNNATESTKGEAMSKYQRVANLRDKQADLQFPASHFSVRTAAYPRPRKGEQA
ncbi:hypothetical protein [Corynebacterium ulceribovis]|uniref:hypothetical protein n=1 Tax=Corynebacterium ulceribovis TaxID=487732 RepID=UPI00036D1DB2|nr:hypothetical protein [Corynebacterium ulceribovis]